VAERRLPAVAPWPDRILFACCLVSLALLSGCAARSHVREAAPATIREATLAAIAERGEPGDWLAIRGLHATDDAVATLSNQPLSHAAVLDPEQGVVIEAEGRGVHTTPIADFVAKAERVLLIKPQAATPETRAAAVLRARGLVGHGYDVLGLAGLNVPDRYYCTELALAIYPRPAGANPVPPVVPPGQLWHWGTIVYDSGPVATAGP